MASGNNNNTASGIDSTAPSNVHVSAASNEPGPEHAHFESAAGPALSAAAAGMPLNMEDVQGLSEVFRCFICMENVRDARLCPYCSKFCCFLCIRRWIVEQRPHCPHCRRLLRVNDLVRCNWADDVISRIEALRAARDTGIGAGRTLQGHTAGGNDTTGGSAANNAADSDDL